MAASVLAACSSSPAKLRQGAPAALQLPQVADQCQAQPELDWCRAAEASRATR